MNTTTFETFTSSTTESIPGLLLSEYDSLTCLVFLLKDEQKLILERRTESLMLLLTRIEEQLVRIREHQARRDEALRKILSGAPPSTQPGLSHRVLQLPFDLREQSLDLAQRIDVQMQLVHELAWQNHVLLSHSVHFLEEVLSPWLDPQQEALTTYGKNGMIQKGARKSNSFQAMA